MSRLEARRVVDGVTISAKDTPHTSLPAVFMTETGSYTVLVANTLMDMELSLRFRADGMNMVTDGQIRSSMFAERPR